MNNFFLEGNKFIGKSTLLREAIRATNSSVSGFYVERNVNSKGQIIGFELRDAKELIQEKPNKTPNLDHLFIQTKNGKQTRNLNVFDTFGKRLVEEAKNSQADVILLDEIGGIELLSKPFTTALSLLIQQPRKVIGVYKSESNYQKQHMRQSFEVEHQRKVLRQTILKDEGQLVALNRENYFSVKKQLIEFLKK
ncbi:hypothetical protein UAY_02114 [Enterococcus moraviensis ATCC BAA-383]|uniref:AAA+ ATPase domain-containing protein n=1 Tax=Enterococcus moraviensis ATCC BAA-383 TaxID=1158609 RepID=R2SUC9_9ENTE|nr:nucleoside-triphosphatase [Enterococcus moraviensis]EOH98845.1 hypothetical protein UAY_02114 [Enterococcus moraviensis ATCC BAA-383]EOT71980.1 hypothetical protein I586_01787 [Enterococcus moraviensis ATCC BAA-383]OJG68099.1 hypothetical protein RV09_GL002210 [Enterococcus moraviensis]